MCKPLPYGEFQWARGDIDFNKIVDDTPEAYALKVGLDCSNELHNLHRDFLFCPESSISPGSKQNKLMATLYNKKKYVTYM